MSEQKAPEVTPRKPYEPVSERLFLAILAASTVAVFVVRLKDPDLTWFSTDMSRDLARAFEWLDGSPSSLLGPEIGHGPRMPGPSYYLLLALAWMLTRSVPGILFLIHLFIICILLWFVKTVVRPLGRTPTLVFWLTFSLLPTQVLVSRMLWSPSLVVSLNLLCLIFFTKYDQSQDWRWLAALGLLPILAFQIHLTAVLGPLVCFLALCWKARIWRPILGLFALICVYLGVAWNSASHYLGMLEVIRRDYTPLAGLSEAYRWTNFRDSLNSHLFVTSEPLKWEELYTLTFRLGAEALEGSTLVWMDRLLLLQTPVTALVLASVLLVAASALRSRHALLEPAILAWAVLAILALASYRFGRGIIPYRYGFSFYPLQFLIVAVAIGQLNRSLRSKGLLRLANSCALLLATLVFIANAFFLWQSYRVCERTGLISEAGAVQELNLRSKLGLIRTAGKAKADTFLSSLHGPLANRLRRVEFYHWNQRQWTAGLYQSLERSGTLSQSEPSQNFYIQRAPTRSAAPIQRLSLSLRDLPSEVTFTYLDADGSSLKTVAPTPSQTLLPCLEAPSSATALLVRFSMSESQSRPVALCFDDHPFNRALSIIGDSVKVDGKILEYRTWNPSRLNQRMVLLDYSSALECEVLFQLHLHNTYSRLDIFRLPDS